MAHTAHRRSARPWLFKAEDSSGTVPTRPLTSALRPGSSTQRCAQGDWLSFRAAAADSRFLQVRKRGGHRLTFFSQNCGTWEQWGLVQEPSQPWEACTLQLRARRMEQARRWGLGCRVG